METLLESLRERKSVGGAAAVARDAVQEAPRAAAAVSRPNDLFASDGRRLFENIPANRKEQILEVFGELNTGSLHAIGYAEYLKTLIRPLGNAGLQAGAMKAITIDYLSVSAPPWW